VVLHVSPEAAVGGPLALVTTGDTIVLDVPARTLTLEVPDDELDRRRRAWTSPGGGPASGYAWLYTRHVMQAEHGADLDFLRGSRGHEVPRDSH
jgi:dihydroxy-acid dehydratase